MTAAIGDVRDDTDTDASAIFGLHAELLSVLAGVSYESPSTIQATTIPPLLVGHPMSDDRDDVAVLEHIAAYAATQGGRGSNICS